MKCFKALSDKTRVRLFYMLHKYELSVNEIVLIVDMIQSGVSRHLKILMESGLLASRRDASFIYYCAVNNEVIQTFILLVEQSFENREMLEQDLEKAREMIKLRKNRTKRFFKTIAPQWDRLKKEVLGNLDLNSIIKANISFNGTVSDLGCGTGELLEILARETSHKLIGIDSSSEMLDQAKLKLSGVHNAQLRLGELEFLPMKNQEIDTAVMSMVLHHISQPELPIFEAYRVLKPGGLFILSDFQKHDQKKIKEILGGAWLGFEKTKIKAWLSKAGFHLKGVTSFMVNHGLTINVFLAEKL